MLKYVGKLSTAEKVVGIKGGGNTVMDGSAAAISLISIGLIFVLEEAIMLPITSGELFEISSASIGCEAKVVASSSTCLWAKMERYCLSGGRGN